MILGTVHRRCSLLPRFAWVRHRTAPGQARCSLRPLCQATLKVVLLLSGTAHGNNNHGYPGYRLAAACAPAALSLGFWHAAARLGLSESIRPRVLTASKPLLNSHCNPVSVVAQAGGLDPKRRGPASTEPKMQMQKTWAIYTQAARMSRRVVRHQSVHAAPDAGCLPRSSHRFALHAARLSVRRPILLRTALDNVQAMMGACSRSPTGKGASYLPPNGQSIPTGWRIHYPRGCQRAAPRRPRLYPRSGSLCAGVAQGAVGAGPQRWA